ncbi:DinB family protein [Hamadaea tsunoensis]|uniref:DinB family protein n=1 Tax=Hamadaea tsunoensis TaxID=53368 RepID=UPI00041C346E|nr:DinB family protein [Hamadaea tsunoensis]
MEFTLGPETEPPKHLADPAELFEAYLDFYRQVILRKLEGLSEEELRGSRLPSGWTPLGLLWHLRCMERRWYEWGFAGRPFDDPWADHGPEDSWAIPADMSSTQVFAAYAAQPARSHLAIAGADLADTAALGGRFATAAEAPTLAWIHFHVLQEYARHAGHLDIARELADGAVGE